jgi:hypothetical protein
MRRYSPRPRSTFVAAALLASLAIGSCTLHEKGHTPQSAWIPGWRMAAPSWRPQNPLQNEMTAYSNQSVRQDVRIGFAADHLRLRLSNELGDEAIEVGRIQIARIGPGDTLGSPVVARFDGQESATLRPVPRARMGRN